MSRSALADVVQTEPAAARLSSDPDLSHRRLRTGAWWQEIPAWAGVDEQTFGNHLWQLRNSVTGPDTLAQVLDDLVDDRFIADLVRGLARSTMAMRVTPYVVSLIDWGAPRTDPLRRQFLPLDSEREPDHPMCVLDALAEQRDAVAPGLTHRYPDKVLLLALDVCPVYCCCCTRSYSIGADTDEVDKCGFRVNPTRWDQAFDYIRHHPEVEDVVVSGGDLAVLKAANLRLLGESLLDIEHVRRIRFATKGLAVLPQKVLSDADWIDALTDVASRGRRQGVHVCVHTHFNHPSEITELSRRACDELFQRGITMRNQSVLLRGVNDDVATMTKLVRRLAWIDVEPYYVYLHDVVPGDEVLRTSLAAAIEIEKQTRGQTAGFMTPTFVCDAFGGGGKRELHSYEVYDQLRGIAVYRSPVVDPDRPFFYFDPLRTIPRHLRQAWQSKPLRDAMVAQAVSRAGL